MMFSTSGRIGSSADLITTFLTVHAGGPPVQPSGMRTVAHPRCRGGAFAQVGCALDVVVLVDEALDGDDAGRAGVARAGDEREEERAVRSRPDRRVRAEVGLLRLQRRGEPRAVVALRDVDRAAAERRRAPRRAAVNGLVDLDPGFRIVQLFGNLDGNQAIVVRTPRADAAGLRDETAIDGSFCLVRNGSPSGHLVPGPC